MGVAFFDPPNDAALLYVAQAIAITMKRVPRTQASTTQRKLGIRTMNWIKIANPRLNKVSASYTESEKPTAVCFIQIVPKTKKQLSNRTKRNVDAAPADDLRRSLLRLLSTRPFPPCGIVALRFHVLVFDNIVPGMFKVARGNLTKRQQARAEND
jgi:hypothetical protein